MFFRKFIILKKQNGKDLKGHARLEVRGSKARLSLSLEGASFKEERKYKAYFAMNEQDGFKEISLGPVEVNRSGRGKLELNFNPKSVNESKIDINSLNILKIKEENTETRDEQIVLCGYIHKEDDSISKLVSREDKERSQGAKKSKEPVKSKENKQESPKVDMAQIEKEIEKDTEKDLEESSQDISNDYNQQVAIYTLNVLENFKQIKPFKTEEENQRWWKITPNKSKDQRGFLPYHNYILNSPCQKQVMSYNNYLFGVAESEGKITHYIYGIPGRNKKNEHPYQGKTGFITWLEDKEGAGDGYWLSYIDVNTGNVVKPL